MTTYHQPPGTARPAPDTLEPADDWRTDAACRDDPDRMFPDPGSPIRIADAKAVCTGCPVRLQCQQWALDSGERHGVWGGLSEDERADLVGRHQQTAPCGTPGAYRRHLRRGEPADEACRRAYAVEQAEKRHRARKRKVSP